VLTALSAAAIVLLGLIIGGVYVYRRKYRKSVIPPLRPAHELALEELQQLRNEDLIKKGIYKEHYFKLSEIFRRYLERRFHFQAVEKTTEEILPEIHHLTGIDQRAKSEAQNFLRNTDLVKFAKYIPDMQEVDKEYQEAVDFVNHTKEEPLQDTTPENTTTERGALG
jgi:hypothetical protein